MLLYQLFFTCLLSLCNGEEYSSCSLWFFNVFRYYGSVMNSLCNDSVCIFFVPAVDIISAIEFDKSGDHLATGDRGGRVVLFERTDNKDVRSFFSSARFTLIVFQKNVLCCNAFVCNVIFFRMVGPGEMLSRWTTQLGILSFDIKQNFRVMNQRYIYNHVHSLYEYFCC